MPVSVTAKRRRDLGPSGAWLPAASTSTTTSPRSVNLMALPTRLSEHLAQPAGVADQRVGHAGPLLAYQFQPLLVRAQGQRVQCVSPGGRIEKSAGSSSSGQPRSWRSRACR